MTSELPESLISNKDIRTMCRYASQTPDGDFVEVGVYRGGSAYRLYELSLQYNRKLHLFDTFEGMPCCDPDLDFHPLGDLDYRKEHVIREMFPEAMVYRGVFPDTLPDDLKNVAFCHVDCDQYESTKAVCDYLPVRMVDNGILYFDDYGSLPGAKKAVDESFEYFEVVNGKAVVILKPEYLMFKGGH